MLIMNFSFQQGGSKGKLAPRFSRHFHTVNHFRFTTRLNLYNLYNYLGFTGNLPFAWVSRRRNSIRLSVKFKFSSLFQCARTSSVDSLSRLFLVQNFTDYIICYTNLFISSNACFTRLRQAKRSSKIREKSQLNISGDFCRDKAFYPCR